MPETPTGMKILAEHSTKRVLVAALQFRRGRQGHIGVMEAFEAGARWAIEQADAEIKRLHAIVERREFICDRCGIRHDNIESGKATDF